MARMRELRASIAPHDGVERYCRDFCDDIFIGDAKFTGPNTIQVSGMDQPLVFKKAMIATGASAAVPPVPGLQTVPHLTNNNFFNLTELPPRLVLIGAGPIGIELSQTMARFGSAVTVLEIGPHLLPREDPDAAEVLREVISKELRIEYGVKIMVRP
jgi:pyruvate/2-oxoglutarate dehydrogenase complex dihydrolipoamide dehydrogenase (E3) component